MSKPNKKQQAAESNQPASTSLHSLAVVVMQAANAASHGMKQAKGDKDGAGSVALRMFASGATEAQLREAFSTVEAEARSGLIAGVTLEPAKRKGKDGGTQYLIPGAFMNAKSITCKAAIYNLPRSYDKYTDLRDAVKAESDRRKLAEATAQEKAYAALVEQVTRLVDTVKEEETKSLPIATLNNMAELVSGLVETFGSMAESAAQVRVTVSAEAATAAEELAEAA